MIPLVLVAAAFTGGGCRVTVHKQTVAVHATGAVLAAPVYYQSALAYRVEDPEKSALVRQNELLTTALVAELQQQRERADRLEAAGGVPAPPASSATAIIAANCAVCHGDPTKAKGSFALSAKPNHAERLLIWNMVESGEMPPKERKQLSAKEKEAIAEWAVVSREELKAAARVVAAVK